MAKRRPPGDDMVRKREDGRWEGRVVVSYDEAGNPKTKNVLPKTKKECVAKLEQMKELILQMKAEIAPCGLARLQNIRTESAPRKRPSPPTCGSIPA